MSLAFSRGDIWNRGDPKRGALASWCACVRSCGVPAFAVGTMAIPKESAVDTNSETASSYAIGGAMTRARTTALLNFSQCSSKTTAMYNAIWTKLLEQVPELKDNIADVVSDFARAQINSSKVNFPRARISGCLFHYKQVIFQSLIISYNI